LETDLLIFIATFFKWYCRLNSQLRACKAGTLPLNHTSSTFFSGYFGAGVSQTICHSWP
jgi:hypothetical protein